MPSDVIHQQADSGKKSIISQFSHGFLSVFLWSLPFGVGGLFPFYFVAAYLLNGGFAESWWDIRRTARGQA